MNYYTKREPQAPLLYEEEYWNREDPDGTVRHKENERQRAIEDLALEIDYLLQLKPGKILDIGCGFGFLLSALPTGWVKYGVDKSRYALKEAKEHGDVREGSVKDHFHTQMDIGTFDVVTMTHVIEHLIRPEVEVEQAKFLLKEGGKLIITTPNFDSACARRFGDNYRMLHDPTHISLFSDHSLTGMLLEEGFKINRIEYPFFNTRHFTPENFERMFDTSKVSPPFYGNIMTFFAEKI